MERGIARNQMNRFAQKYTDQELLQIVLAVATHVSPGDPGSTSQLAYDSGRAAAGLDDGPRAYRIAKRLNCSWKEVLRLAVSAPNPGQVLGARSYDRVRNVLTKDEVAHYIQVVAEILDTNRLSINEYDQCREGLIRADNRRFRHSQGTSNIMPSAQNIVASVGDWDRALSWAGLRPKLAEGKRAYPVEMALDDFISDYGFAPTKKMLHDYQKRRGVATTPYGKDFRKWRDEQLEHGLANRHGNVRRITHPNQAPDGWDQRPPSPAPEGYSRVRPKLIDLDECLADLDRAIDLAQGQKLTQNLYQRLSAQHHLVSMNSIQIVAVRTGNGTWGKLRDEAIRRRSKKPRHQPRVRSKPKP